MVESNQDGVAVEAKSWNIESNESGALVSAGTGLAEPCDDEGPLLAKRSELGGENLNGTVRSCAG